jgi:phosphoribosylformylglycinamidine cyclo-ligase
MPESTGQNSQSHIYKDSGVDIDRANRMLSGLKKVISSTHTKDVLSDLSSFCGLFRLDTSKYRDPVLTSSTDGVGTKLILAKETGDYSTVGQDLVAMSINDLICCGAKALFFLDYIACGSIDTEKISAVITSVADACRFCDTALLGGETAEMPDMYHHDEIDLAGFAVGIVEKDKILKPEKVKCGDLVIGIPSSGLHSNGFSLVRKIIDSKGLDLNKSLQWTEGKNLGKFLLTPTRLYAPLIGHILDDEKIKVKGIANITGGGFYDNMKRIIPEDLDVMVEKDGWDVPAVFKALQQLGNIPHSEMYKVFNMGIGMVLIVSPESLDGLKYSAQDKGEAIIMLGQVTGGTGTVKIKGIDL